MTKVLFVCLGNICRSPMAEAVIKKESSRTGFDGFFVIDSAATSTYEVGSAPHPGTQAILAKEHVDTREMIARQIRQEDFQKFDWIIGMDQSNVADLKQIAPIEAQEKIQLFLSPVIGKKVQNVPDPYYTNNFEETYRLINEGLEKWLELWMKNDLK